MIASENEIEFYVFRKKTAGSPSGPAAEFDLRFFMMRQIISGLISTSLMVSIVCQKRDGNWGRTPSSIVNTDLK